ncbi:hypothetical protein DRW03_33935 [Corallococcus sp. H22C18031201]|nr:hypothetical protein DRW03_33935 [Corallococcus sp. H22C18031201]
MFRRMRQMIRGLSLALTCAMLALGAGASAHPLPTREGSIAVVIGRSVAAPRPSAVRRATHAAPLRVRARRVQASRPRARWTATRGTAPPRRLFLHHRALLH